ncbi:MAG: hypothetical protein ACREFU_11500 [Acetobacteraceae bacterium]
MPHVSGGTRSAAGPDCRDAFRDYLGARLDIQACPNVPSLPDLVRCRGQPA